jgi:hypothetical protein
VMLKLFGTIGEKKIQIAGGVVRVTHHKPDHGLGPQRRAV